jgi:hypothetical protein
MSKEGEKQEANIHKPKPLIQNYKNRVASTGYDYENIENLKFDSKKGKDEKDEKEEKEKEPLKLNLGANPYVPKKMPNKIPLTQSYDISYNKNNQSNRQMPNFQYISYSNQPYYNNFNNNNNYNNRYSNNNTFVNNNEYYNNNSYRNNQSFHQNYQIQNNNQTNIKRSFLDSNDKMFIPKDKKKQFKEDLEKIKKTDPIKFDLTEYLNILTVDNYEVTKKLIFDKISPDTAFQEKFLDVLFQKAVHEKAFVNIYAKLCKELDKDLPQKIEKKNNTSLNKKPTSIMRNKLLEKCREIFKIENNSKFDEYIKVDDPIEREQKLKKIFLGNVNFIGELINIQLLSKKIVFQCIDNLFKRCDNTKTDEKLRLINYEAIVILIDKFGTLINKHKSKIKEEDMITFTSKIDNYISKLDEIQSKQKDLPGYIKYKIINLIEKKKGGWEETQFENNISAIGKEEVRKKYEESQKIGNLNKGKKLTQEQVNDKIREDLNNWKDFIEEGEKIEHYQWEIITDLYNKQSSLSEFLTGFIENCIDFVQNKKTLDYANKYISELLLFYSDKIYNEEKEELIKSSLELVSQVHNFYIDNNYLIDIWSNIIFQLNNTSLMNYETLGTLNELYDDDLKSLFSVFKNVIDLDEKAKDIFSSFKYVKDNKDLFDNIIQG